MYPSQWILIFSITQNTLFYSWIKIDQLDVTCFIISLFKAQRVSNVSTSILRSLRLICWVISWVVLLWGGVVSVCRLKLLRMDVLTFETCWALNNEIKQVTSSWSGLSSLNYQDDARSNKHKIYARFPSLWDTGVNGRLILKLRWQCELDSTSW